MKRHVKVEDIFVARHVVKNNILERWKHAPITNPLILKWINSAEKKTES